MIFSLAKRAGDCMNGTGIFAESTGGLWKEFERRRGFGAVSIRSRRVGFRLKVGQKDCSKDLCD